MSRSLFLIFVLFFSCTHQVEFDKEKWGQRDDVSYNHRNSMLDDLTTNYDLVGLSYNQLIDLLGDPRNYAFADSAKLYYIVYEDYGFDIDPVYMKNLVFTINQDSIVTEFEVVEWEK